MLKEIKKRKREMKIGLAGVILGIGLYLFLRHIIAPVVRSVWIKEVEGLENIPETGPAIIASNHESYFDFICFYAISPRKVQYLAAEKFFESRFWKPLMLATGQIKVDRKDPEKSFVHEQAQCILKNGGLLAIFPEGTRSRTGEMGRAYTGVTKFALKAKAPIIPVGMIGTFDILPPHKKMPKFKKCRIKIEKPILHEEHFDKEHTKELLRILTDDLMLLLGRMVGKEYKHHYSYAQSGACRP